MNTELISRMIDSDVLDDTASGELETSKDFRRALFQYKQKLQDPGSKPDSAHDPPDRILTTLQAQGGELHARYLALADMVEAPSEQLLASAISLNWLFLPDTELTGVPTSFTPIPADQISTVVRCFPRSILYAWREDCDPCDIVRSDFDALFAETTTGKLGLFAIFGPSYGEKLRDEYEIFGAPTVALFQDSQIITRLAGAKDRSVLKAELRRIRQT